MNSFQKTTFLTLIAAFLFSIYSYGQLPQLNELKFNTYTTNDGLTTDFIVKIQQDKRGFLWIATVNGLSRFDGLHYKNYTFIPADTNSLRSIWVTDLLLDKQGVLWITTEGGICWYDERNDNFHYINAVNTLNILYKAPMCLGDDGNIWAACENGLVEINTLTKQLIATELKNTADPQCIISINKEIWIGTRGHGIFIYQTKNKTWSTVQENIMPTSSHVMNFYTDADGFWGATDIGLLKIYDAKKIVIFNKPIATITPNIITALMCVTNFKPITGDSMLLCGTYSRGLLLFNKRLEKFTYKWYDNNRSIDDVPHGVFNSLYPLKNILWIATDHGLCKLNINQQDYVTSVMPALTAPNGNNYLISQVKESLENINQFWAATLLPDAQIILYDNVTKKLVKKYQAPTKTDGYTSIFIDGDFIWAFRANAIDKFSKQNGFIKTFTTKFKIYNATFSNPNIIWLGTNRGIASFNTATEKLVEYQNTFKGTETENTSFNDAFPVEDLKFDGKQTIWLVCIKYGIFSFDIATHAFKSYRQKSNEQVMYDTRNRCSSLDIDKAGNIWVGTMAGIGKLNPTTQQFINYNGGNGIASAYVYSIKLDNEMNIWGRGNAGVFLFNATKNVCTNYKLTPQVNNYYYKQRIAKGKEKMILGFEGGIVSFNQSQTLEKVASNNIVLNSLKLFNKEYFFDRDSVLHTPLEFSYKENVLSLDFTCINFNQPEKINYAYKLEGLNKEWIENGQMQTVSFSNLSPGKYNFYVKAKIGNDEWATPIKLIGFTITPVFWQRTWFIVVALLLLAAILYWFFKTRIKKIHQRQTEQLKLKQLEVKQYQEQLEIEQIISYFSSSLSNKNTEEDVIWDVAKNLIHKLGFANCMIYLWNEDKTILLQKAGYGPNGSLEEVIKKPFDTVLWQGIVGHVAATKKPILLANTSNDKRYRPDELTRLSELCVPALYNDELISVIDSEEYAENYYTPQHLQILTTIAALMASKLVSIKNAKEIQDRNDELNKVNKQMTEMELAMLRSQMNPHFIFNSLNSIQKYIWDNKQEDASEYLTKFSRLIRMILEHSSKKLITLEEEIAALQLYLELEHRRCNNKFDYTFTVDASIKTASTLITPMLIQPHIENAIWHGLLQKQERGLLQIFIHIPQPNILTCIIEDDGIGRIKSAEINARKEHKSTSLGTAITQKRLNIINTLGLTADIQVKDKYDEDGNAAGTIITLQIPIEIFEKIK